MNTLITPDLIFSDWILVWSLCYYFLLPKILGLSSYAYESLNPSIGLWAMLMYNIIEWIYLWSKSVSWILLIEFALVIFLIKVIPIILLRNIKIRTLNNVIFIGFLFVLYNIYLYIKNTNAINVYNKINKSLVQNENKTPFLWIFSQIKTIFNTAA